MPVLGRATDNVTSQTCTSTERPPANNALREAIAEAKTSNGAMVIVRRSVAIHVSIILSRATWHQSCIRHSNTSLNLFDSLGTTCESRMTQSCPPSCIASAVFTVVPHVPLSPSCPHRLCSYDASLRHLPDAAVCLTSFYMFPCTCSASIS